MYLVLTPGDADALSRAVGEAHRRFTAFVNARARTTGHLFQGRFASFAMDDAHFLNALRYLAFNPVCARTHGGRMDRYGELVSCLGNTRLRITSKFTI